jgi:hypothetical protein
MGRVRGGYQCPHYPPHLCHLKSGITQTRTQTQSTRIFPVKTGMVRASTHMYEFYCHAYYHFLICHCWPRIVFCKVDDIELMVIYLGASPDVLIMNSHILRGYARFTYLKTLQAHHLRSARQDERDGDVAKHVYVLGLCR